MNAKTENKPRKRSSVQQSAISKDNGSWMEHEIHYWESAHDRVMLQYLDLKAAHDNWKEAHGKVVQLVQQWEVWYKNLEKDRNLYIQWDRDKKVEIENLQRSLSSLKQAIEFWQQEHRKVVALVEQRSEESKQMKIHWDVDNKKLTAQIQQWEIWYKSLEKDRDLYKQWDQDKKQEIERLNRSLDELNKSNESVRLVNKEWQDGHKKLEHQVQQLETWYKSLQTDHNLYKKWDEDKKDEIVRLNKVVEEMVQAREFWITEHAKVVQQVQQWVTWFQDMQKNRDLYKQWDEDKKDEIVRLNKVVEELVQAREFWITEHTKVVQQVQQWVTWFRDIQKNRDLYKQWDEDKKDEIVRLNKVVEEMVQAREFWITEHAKVVQQVQQWVTWFQDMQKNRDLYKQWDEDKKIVIEQQQQTIQELRSWVDALLDHPFYYLWSFLRRKFKGKNRLSD